MGGRGDDSVRVHCCAVAQCCPSLRAPQDSDYATRTPRKPFGGIAGAGGSGGIFAGAGAAGGFLPGDLAAAAGTPSNLGKVGDAGKSSFV